MIRDSTPLDFESVLRLNEEWEHVTSPLDLRSLADLHDLAAYHRLIEQDGRVVAFLLAIGPGTDYGSQNYRWFDRSTPDFLYIDRVIVARESQGAGLGAALYDDVLLFACEHDYRRLVCEVDIEPFNAASDAFHTRRGFAEVGTQRIGEYAKLVSLRQLVLDASVIARGARVPARAGR
ncbi:MAG: GNAT family N-acetyltransferase [Coriobacteriia bacterium]|nr:GNAT family N-acetyltransferase [Coriobacteriia bacterium]